MLVEEMKLDSDQHHNFHPRFDHASGLHVVTASGKRINVGHVEPKTSCTEDGFDPFIDVEETGCLNGEWFLLRESWEANENQVLRFSDRESLIRFLWDAVYDDNWALRTLWQLDALRVDVEPESAVRGEENLNRNPDETPGAQIDADKMNPASRMRVCRRVLKPRTPLALPTSSDEDEFQDVPDHPDFGGPHDNVDGEDGAVFPEDEPEPCVSANSGSLKTNTPESIESLSAKAPETSPGAVPNGPAKRQRADNLAVGEGHDNRANALVGIQHNHKRDGCDGADTNVARMLERHRSVTKRRSRSKPKAILNDLTAKRAAIRLDMYPATRDLADRHDADFRETRGSMLIRYDQGDTVNQVMNDPESHGPNAIRQLAEFFNVAPAYYRALAMFARKFQRAEVEAWARRVGPSGPRLAWEQLVECSRLTRASDRQMILERALAERWSLRDLELNIADSGLPTEPLGRWNEPAKRRRPRKPKEGEAEQND